jgi:hypothetical protein
VACILQHVPLKERLTRCALVCRAWAAAAAAAPAVLEVRLQDKKHCQQLQDWVGKHAGVLAGLTVDLWREDAFDWVAPLLQLPLPKFLQLHSLHLGSIKVQLAVQGVVTRSSAKRQRGSSLTGASSSASSVSTVGDCIVLPQLQQLRLGGCHLTVQLAAQLLSATTLTHLNWGAVHLYSSSNWRRDLTQEQVFTAMWQWLQQLPKLSSLRLEESLPLPASLTAVITLQHLQRFGMGAWGPNDIAAVAAVLPAGLTALDLDVYGTIPCSPSQQVGGAVLPEVCLTRFSSLQRLGGEGLRMRPSNLACMTTLRELNLADPCNPDGSACSSRELLAALQHLNQLRGLRLLGCQLQAVKPQPQQQGDSYQCFSALTASTQLTALTLAELCDVPIPAAAFDHMFPTGRVLQSLRVLRVEGAVFYGEPCVGEPQVARIAASCPALQELSLDRITGTAFDTSCLLQLPRAVTRVQGVYWTRPTA